MSRLLSDAPAKSSGSAVSLQITASISPSKREPGAPSCPIFAINGGVTIGDATTVDFKDHRRRYRVTQANDQCPAPPTKQPVSRNLRHLQVGYTVGMVKLVNSRYQLG